MKVHVQAMVDFRKLGVPTLDYGNNIRQVALEEGLKDAFAFPGFVPAYIRPLFCRGIGPFRWAACLAIRRTSTKRMPRSKRSCPRTRTCTTGSTWRASVSRSRACPRAFAGLVWVYAQAGPRLQRNGRARETVGADCDWPRSPRFRLGRLAQPRDGGDERRL